MTIDQAITLIEQMLKVTALVSLPPLATAFVVGLLISIFQAATQIQEMTITFIPKIIATVAALIIFGTWMLTMLVDYYRSIFDSISKLIQ